MSLESFANGTVVGGVVAIILFFLREWRKIWLQNKRTEQTTPLEVKSMAATTFEAEMVATRKSFDQDRALKDNTIRDLQARNEELIGEAEFEHGRFLAERDKRRAAEAEIEVLRERAREMQRQIQDLLDTIEVMSDRIQVQQEEENEDFRLHPGPGT